MEVERHLLREMIRIRRTEETLAELYPAQAAGTGVADVQATFARPY